ncbi:MAG TPA: hypothetical protein VIM58_10385, partial [Candidatus Methylacidiphilales bacterium]
MVPSRTPSFISAAAPSWAWIQPVIYLCGALVALMGGMTVFQWLTHGTALLHIGPGKAILHFNSSLSFFVGGLGLLALVRGWRIPAAAAGAFVLLLAAATILEYVLGVDLGIDQAVVHAYMTSNPSHPGRMSEITSTNWVLTGAILIVEALALSGSWRLVATSLLASLVLANNGMALVGYWIGLPDTYTWTIFHRVTLQTATGFCLLGLGLVLRSFQAVSNGQRRDAKGLPLAAALGVLTASLILWQVLVAGNRWQILNDMDAVRTTLGAQMIEQIDSRVRALERMGKRIEVRPGGMTHAEWLADARLYVEHERVFRAIGRADASGKIVWWIHDDSGMEPGPDGRIGTRALQDEARRQAEEGGGTVASHADLLGEGESSMEGFVTWFPFYKSNGG